MAVRVPFSDLGAQFREIESDLVTPLMQLMHNGEYVGAGEVSEFEDLFARYADSQFCVGVGNGTDAIEILLKAMDLPVGSTVLVPDNSFVATAEAVLNVGLNLRLVDVGLDYRLSFESVDANLDESVSALVVTHLYGYPNSMEWLIELAEKRNFQIIEDCAQAHGARTESDVHVGNLGSGGAFSFYPGKNLGAAGDAGAIITNNPSIAERARRLRNHGRLGKFDHNLLGRNSRLDSIQALILKYKLERLPHWIAARQRNAKTYFEHLTQLPIILPPQYPGQSSYHLFVIQLECRDELRDFLRSSGIETGIHYPKAISNYAPYSEYLRDGPSVASQVANRVLSLPVGEHLSTGDVIAVSREINNFFGVQI